METVLYTFLIIGVSIAAFACIPIMLFLVYAMLRDVARQITWPQFVYDFFTKRGLKKSSVYKKLVERIGEANRLTPSTKIIHHICSTTTRSICRAVWELPSHYVLKTTVDPIKEEWNVSVYNRGVEQDLQHPPDIDSTSCLRKTLVGSYSVDKFIAYVSYNYFLYYKEALLKERIEELSAEPCLPSPEDRKEDIRKEVELEIFDKEIDGIIDHMKEEMEEIRETV